MSPIIFLPRNVSAYNRLYETARIENKKEIKNALKRFLKFKVVITCTENTLKLSEYLSIDRNPFATLPVGFSQI